jgi:hypothetical protein
LDPYVLHGPKSNDLCDEGQLIKETFIAISHTFSMDTTNPHLPFFPIPIYQPTLLASLYKNVAAIGTLVWPVM